MKNDLISCVDKHKKYLVEMAKGIWENPETSYEEYFASGVQKKYLEESGFRVNTVQGIETAFVAEFGEGRPVIGILGEYDALPGLSQKVSLIKEAITESAPGHGCGHNLLGVGGVGAVVALKEVMERDNIKGTIKYFGCPAEEGGVGKCNMYKKGCFRDIDCAFSWHPFDVNSPWRPTSLSNFSMKFRFKGITSHAAQSPHTGRSALDAVELMNVGANYLREHILDSIRMHYVITNGGERPNIVPGYAESWYFLRGKKASDVKSTLDRLVKVAKGAAMMTETEMEYEVIDAMYDYLPNQSLTDVVSENMRLVGAPNFKAEDLDFAHKLANTITKEERRNVATSFQGNLNIVEKYLHDDIADFEDYKYKNVSGSTDVGDISYIVPTAQFAMAAWPIGTAAHTWQACSSSGSNVGFEAMLSAAKVLACSAYDILMDREKLEKSKEEFTKSLDGFEYKPLV